MEAGRVAIFYVPDVVHTHDRAAAFSGVRLSMGDGASLKRLPVHKPDESFIGRSTPQPQLTRCRKEGVLGALFTYCRSVIVEGDERTVGAELRSLAEERRVHEQNA